MSIVDDLGLGDRECVAIVGAGGKTTLLQTIGREAEGSNRRVILTTTTHMSPDQIGDPVVWSADPREIEAALETGLRFAGEDAIPSARALWRRIAHAHGSEVSGVR